MNSAWFVLAAVGGFAVGVAAVIVGDMLSEEFRERVDNFPEWLIRCAGRRLSEDVRVPVRDEWLAELDAILDQVKGLPLTRLVVGTRFAFGVLRAAGEVDCALHGDGRARPPFPPRIDLAVVRAVICQATPAVRVGAYGVGFGMAIGVGADLGAAAEVALGAGGGVGALMLGVLVGARMAAMSAFGVGLGAGLGAEFGINAKSLGLAFGSILVAALAGTILARARGRRGRGGDQQ